MYNKCIIYGYMLYIVSRPIKADMAYNILHLETYI